MWQSDSVQDCVIAEEPLEVWLQIQTASANNNSMKAQPLLTLMRTPGDDINLVTGWLLTSGTIDSLSQIKAIHHSGLARVKQGSSNRVLVTLGADVKIDLPALIRQEYASSACGVCGQQSIENILLRLEQKQQIKNQGCLPLKVADIAVLMDKFSQALPLFKQTGGNHGVALFKQNAEIVDIREDVGRHNALDKLIGANAELLFTNSEQQKGLGLILSGRVGFEMIQKAVMANINYVLALGAPSSLAIELAKEADIVLVGFIKAQRFNVYCGEQKLAFS
ncbi:hypothetical protein AX660_21610 [Paraglaciecola hydrolytica]|uniref:Sulfur carrier protein FdhD n=1 Tax=Paraglaciecola hydrolytica TaxID=1799789 RepID=A0A148KM56_9ALTE|nr:hypothetical protein AX660_21610 [Paraglaciecola hydrolytica]